MSSSLNRNHDGRAKRSDRLADGPRTLVTDAEVQGVESHSKYLARLRTELAEKTGRLRRARDEVAGLECRILLSECVRRAELLYSALVEIAQFAEAHEAVPPDWGQNRILNCRRAIDSALHWAGEAGQ